LLFCLFCPADQREAERIALDRRAIKIKAEQSKKQQKQHWGGGGKSLARFGARLHMCVYIIAL